MAFLLKVVGGPNGGDQHKVASYEIALATMAEFFRHGRPPYAIAVWVEPSEDAKAEHGKEWIHLKNIFNMNDVVEDQAKLKENYARDARR